MLSLCLCCAPRVRSALGGVLVLTGLYLYIWGKAASSSNSSSSISLGVSSSPDSRGSTSHSVFLANDEEDEEALDLDSDRAPLAVPKQGFVSPRG